MLKLAIKGIEEKQDNSTNQIHSGIWQVVVKSKKVQHGHWYWKNWEILKYTSGTLRFQVQYWKHFENVL